MAHAHAAQRHPAVLGDLLPGSLARDAALVAGSAALVGAAAQLAVPLPGTPIPVTGQTFAVLLAGAALGPGRAALGMLVYLLAGTAGVPWFTDGTSGTGSPTLGYVIGFLAAATLVGRLAQLGGDRTPLRTAATMLTGTLVMYATGVPYLMAALNIDLARALHLGVTPFLAGDALKVLLAAALLPAAWKITRAARR
ncbi:biotin transporter BioY [Actinomadura madurae]|uniref:Biotin transporter n=1 Tax=Actinomadura madurae TaxID=1993 RepID=A0A1I5YR73_9ACTN|nr:biotin transporter BioY [Actinomadura madurae]SFQ46726.1 biotin transport system substrate-specific component [Actinomadura madurae]SPT57921.1 Biotin ECF transporter S component BioY2 [Actinomadura madurae]